MVPHCERMFHVEQTADLSDRRLALHAFRMFHVEHCDAADGSTSIGFRRNLKCCLGSNWCGAALRSPFEYLARRMVCTARLAIR
jgi:hypothetical protein